MCAAARVSGIATPPHRRSGSPEPSALRAGETEAQSGGVGPGGTAGPESRRPAAPGPQLIRLRRRSLPATRAHRRAGTCRRQAMVTGDSARGERRPGSVCRWVHRGGGGAVGRGPPPWLLGTPHPVLGNPLTPGDPLATGDSLAGGAPQARGDPLAGGDPPARQGAGEGGGKIGAAWRGRQPTAVTMRTRWE